MNVGPKKDAVFGPVVVLIWPNPNVRSLQCGRRDASCYGASILIVPPQFSAEGGLLRPRCSRPLSPLAVNLVGNAIVDVTV